MTAPVCFASPSTVSATARACLECGHSRSCIAGAQRLLEGAPATPLLQRERQRLALVGAALARAAAGGAGEQGAQPALERPGRIGLTREQEQELQRLPQRVASQVRSLWQKNWFEFARRELQQGRNPAPSGWKRTFCLLLIEGGCSSLELQNALQAEGMTPGSARSTASVATTIFHIGRLIAHRNGRYVISPN